VALPKVIGHRGAAAYAPENTLEGLREAARRGAGWVEFDVKLTADGMPIVFHDDALDRTTNAKGEVAAASLERIRGLDAGSWFGPAFAGARVPTLEEALRLVLEQGLGANIEIKPCPGREAETAERAVAEILRLWPAKRPPPLISSFKPACLAAAKAAGIDTLVGLGGGSSLDTAKGCNFLLTNGGRMRDYWGVGKASKPMLPLIAIPTTAGTGSECQSYALIADEATRQKMACGDPKAAARIALLDPTLTLSLPRRVTR